MTEVRARAEELGVPAVSGGAAATLRLLAAATGARAVVEVGTGLGVSGAWLLAGMAPDGVLTSVDLEADHQRAARELFGRLGVAHSRTRLIAGRALEVLPRLTDGAYDLVLVDGDEREHAECVAQAARLLRPGGVLVVAGVLAGERLVDAAQRDPDTLALRELVTAVRDDPRWLPVLLPVGTGLLIAALAPPASTD